MKNMPRILYFIKGVLPSNEAQEIALELGGNVAFRNANFVPSTGSIEACDGVAGEVPALYKDCPTAEEALKAFDDARKDAVNKRKKADKAKATAKQEKKESDEAAAKAAEAENKATEAENKVNGKQPANTGTGKGWKPNA